MNKQLLSLFTCFVFAVSFSAAAFSQSIAVKGSVFDTDFGHPIAHQRVYATIDTLPASGFFYRESLLTDSLGEYHFTLSLPEGVAPVQIRLETKDCQDVRHQQFLDVTSNGPHVLEAEPFYLCGNGTDPSCSSWFDHYPEHDLNGEWVMKFEGYSSTPIVDWQWDWGQGPVQGGQFMHHRFPEEGVYDVCLTTVDDAGCISSTCDSVYVYYDNAYGDCHVDFESEYQGDMTYQFWNHSYVGDGVGATYHWDFGDGHTSSERDPKHTYETYGENMVCLEVITEKGCQTQDCQFLVLADTNTNCVAAFEYEPDTTAGPMTFRFYNASAGDFTRWRWYFSENDTSNLANPVYTFQEEGFHMVGLLIYNERWTCWDSMVQSIWVDDGLPNECYGDFHFWHSPDDTYRIDLEAYNGPEIYKWEWDFGDGTQGRGQRTSHHYQEPGEYRICLKMWGEGNCFIDICKYVRVPFEQQPPCFAEFGYDELDDGGFKFFAHDQDPSGATLNHFWDFGDGGSSQEATPTHTYQEDGIYEVCLLVSDGIGCEDTVCERVYVLRDPQGGCQAAFTYTRDTTAVHPFMYQFFNQSTGTYTDWEWHFDDGTVSKERHPRHSFPGPGTYFAGILIYDSLWNCWDSAAMTIFIEGDASCRGDFRFHPDPTDDLKVHVEGVGGPNAVDWTWHFGDGHRAQGPLAAHRYVQPGVYRVCLEVTYATGCVREVCKPIRVPFDNLNCQAKFVYDTQQGRIVAFENLSHARDSSQVLQYKWDFGDGNFGSTQHPVHQYERDNMYKVCLEVFDANGCAEKYCEQVFILHGPGGDCEAAIQAQSRADDPFTYKFTNLSSGTYTDWIWQFGDGHVSRAAHPIHRYAGPGRYLAGILIYDSTWHCWDSTTVTLVVEAPDPPLTCQNRFDLLPVPNDPFTFVFEGYAGTPVLDWHWTFGDGEDEEGKVAAHTFQAPGIYRVCLETRDSLGCVARFCQPVEVPFEARSCEADFGIQRLGGGVIKFENLSQGSAGAAQPSYRWHFGDGRSSEEVAPVHAFPANGNYRVCLELTDETGCMDTLCKNITIRSAEPPAECEAHFYYYTHSLDEGGTTIQFENNSHSTVGALQYQWTFGDGGSSMEVSPRHTYTAAGVYTACLTITGSGCTSTYCEAVYVEASDFFYDLCGSVFTGHMAADEVRVYLITLDIETQRLVAKDSVIVKHDDRSDSTYYCFENVPSNFYITKAALLSASSYYRDYVPTYFGGELFWADGNFVPLFTDRYHIDIHMIRAQNPGGPGFIGGNVFQGANKNEQAASRVQLMLLDEEDEALAYTYSDEEGAFMFANIPLGSYRVYAEVMNLETVPVVATIDEENPGNEDVGVEVLDEQVVGFLFDHSEYAEGIGLPYPNPSKGIVWLDIELKQSSRLRIEVRNAMGQLMWVEDKRFAQGAEQLEIPMAHMAEGVYLINLIVEGRERILRRVVKY